jgi:hypothetical protein
LYGRGRQKADWRNQRRAARFLTSRLGMAPNVRQSLVESGHLMRRIREILLTQYVGAIVVGFIAAQGLLGFVALVTTPLRWYLEFRNRQSSSVLYQGTAQQVPFPWDSLLSLSVSILLYLLIAYSLARWLYPRSASPGVPEPSSTHNDTDVDAESPTT